MNVKSFMHALRGLTDKKTGRGKAGEKTYRTLLAAGMHFQDRYNFDVERVKRCVIHYSTPEGMFPFCAYNCGPVHREWVEGKHTLSLQEWRERNGTDGGRGCRGRRGRTPACRCDGAGAHQEAQHGEARSRKTLQLFLRGNLNYLTGKPLVVSFELTSSCNANCLHCDKGGMRAGETPLSPAQIAQIYRELRPCGRAALGRRAAPAAGPRRRRPADEGVERAPYIILVTNGYLLRPELYLRAARGGRRPGLDLARLPGRSGTTSSGPSRGSSATCSASCPNSRRKATGTSSSTRRSHGSMSPTSSRSARRLPRWGASMSYSAYSALRTGNRDLLVESPADLRRLRAQIDRLLDMKRQGWNIRNPVRRSREHLPATSPRTASTAAGPGIVSCSSRPRATTGRARTSRSSAGRGGRSSRSSRRRTRAAGCYVAIRSYCDKSYGQLVREQFLTRLIRRG